MRSFRLLKADEIECRAQQVKENGVVLLLYKTARTDAQLLDETFGIYNWQCKYDVIDGTLYCGIGIKEKGSDEWVWKWNCGTESNMEAEKGRASDALKRAGFVLGLGTELYSAPFIFVPSSKANITKRIVKNEEKFFCNDDFVVTKIGYDKDERINELEVSVKGQTVWSMKPPKAAASEGIVCEKCGTPILAYHAGKGMVYPARHAEASKNKFGKVLCLDCIENEGQNS